jgi:tetratricopeptide (TPR) repeat protein
MKKFLLILFAIIIIFIGIFGADYFSKIRRAGTDLDRAVVLITAEQYDASIEHLKNITSQYRYRVVRAPALWLLAETYEKIGNYGSSLETHRMLLTDERISAHNNWHIRSVIEVSKLFRNKLVSVTEDRSDATQKYIDTIRIKIALKEQFPPFSPLSERVLKSFFASGSSLYPLIIDNGTIMDELNTELGFLYLMAKKYKMAEEIFSGLDSNVARFGLARVYMDTGNYNRGMDILEELLAYNTTGKLSAYYLYNMYEYAEILFEKKLFNESIALYSNLVLNAPNSIYAEMASYKLATYYYGKGKTNDALQFIDKTMGNKRSEKDEDAYLLKGFIYYDNRDFVRALKIFNTFPKRFPESTKMKTAREWEAMCERSIKYLG